MSRLFTDDDLLTWEAYSSGGAYGLPDRPKIIFNCLSHPGSRGRYVIHEGDEADAAGTVRAASSDELRGMLQAARELD